MKYQTNGVACIFKAYAIINLCASVVIALADDFYVLNILFLASALVASIGIYAIGDGAGVTRGLAQAVPSRVKVARVIADRL